MSLNITYTKARANFAKLLDAASIDKEIVMINRRNSEDVALIAASELESLLETAHLLRSPKNTQRLLSALNRAMNNEGNKTSLSELVKDLNFE